MDFLELCYALYIRYWNRDGDIATLPSYTEFREKLSRLLTQDATTKVSPDYALPSLDAMERVIKQVSRGMNVPNLMDALEREELKIIRIDNT